MDRREIGFAAEARAARFLEGLGMKILARNVVFPGTEIDIIAEDAGAIIFIEVKERRSARSGLGREAVTPAKQRRICKGALAYLAKNGLMDHAARFDVIEIQSGRITHIRDAFPYQGPAF